MDYFFLGDPELVTAFRFVGIEGVSVRDANAASAVFRRMTESYNETAGAVLPAAAAGLKPGGTKSGGESCRILILTEEVADWLGDTLIQWQLSNRYPLAVEIPGLMGRLKGRKTLVDSIREAIGIHV